MDSYWNLAGSNKNPARRDETDAQSTIPQLDFETRLRRSQGRGSRECSVTSKLTREELNDVESRALTQGKAVGEWAREVLLREARRSEDDPIFTEVVAVRMLLNRALAHFAQTDKLTLDALTAMSETVRLEKRPEAQKLMAQYTAQAPKER